MIFVIVIIFKRKGNLLEMIKKEHKKIKKESLTSEKIYLIDGYALIEENKKEKNIKNHKF